MSNGFIPQGTLNRILTSVIVPNFPELNVTSAFLGEASVRLTFTGETTAYLPTLTGGVTSPEPYQFAEVEINLLKSQGLALLWELQRTLLSTIGPVTVITDSTTQPVYPLHNCSIMNVGALVLNGKDAGYNVSVRGFYQLNASLYF